MSMYMSNKGISPTGIGRIGKVDGRGKPRAPHFQGSPLLAAFEEQPSMSVSHSGGWLNICDILLDTFAYLSAEWPLKSFIAHVTSP